MSTFTPNINLEQPANGSYNNDWNVPVNANYSIIDSARGGTLVINVTGVTGPDIGLSQAQVAVPNVEFIGTLSATLYYVIPQIGGFWSVRNATTGPYQIYWNVAAGLSVLCTQGYNTLCKSDSVNMLPSDDGTAYLAQLQAQAAAQGYANTAQSNAEGYTQAFASNASNISSGTVANAHLNNVGIGPGVTIAANPGTTPSGAPGSVWFYY